MQTLVPLIKTIDDAAKRDGLPALALRSGVPYTTLVDWQRAGWRPKAVRTLEKIAAASQANDSSPSQKAA